MNRNPGDQVWGGLASGQQGRSRMSCTILVHCFALGWGNAPDQGMFAHASTARYASCAAWARGAWPRSRTRVKPDGRLVWGSGMTGHSRSEWRRMGCRPGFPGCRAWPGPWRMCRFAATVSGAGRPSGGQHVTFFCAEDGVGTLSASVWMTGRPGAVSWGGHRLQPRSA